MQNRDLYRDASLEKISSSDRLDEMLSVTTSRAWIALVAAGLVVVATVGWGFFGSIPVRVQGEGMLIRSGGLYDVEARGPGQTVEVFVRPGERVDSGRTVARVAQPDLAERIRNAKASLQEKRNRYDQLKSLGQQDVRLQSSYLNEEAESLRNSIESDEQRIQFLRDRLDQQKKLLDQGLITPQTLESTRESLQAAREQKEQHRQRLLQIEAEKTSLNSDQRKQLLDLEIAVQEAKRNVEQLEEEYDRTSTIVTPHAGRVLEVMVSGGDHVREGDPVVRLDRVTQRLDALQAVVYVPSSEGKRVEEGMEVQVSPSTVKREEFGFVHGVITSVSEFPATRESMERTLRNARLVNRLAGDGAPFAVLADLSLDSTTVSGLSWSSSEGPPEQVRSGTPCTAMVVTRRMRPVELILPTIRTALGIE